MKIKEISSKRILIYQIIEELNQLTPVENSYLDRAKKFANKIHTPLPESENLDQKYLAQELRLTNSELIEIYNKLTGEKIDASIIFPKK